jgi:cytochrome b involved in lipid metabolism
MGVRLSSLRTLRYTTANAATAANTANAATAANTANAATAANTANAATAANAATTNTTVNNTRKIYYTHDEISKHTSIKSVWIVAGNKVYDITSFLKNNKHPGGSMCILECSSKMKDCLADYKMHTKSGKHLWKQYLIGYVKPLAK